MPVPNSVLEFLVYGTVLLLAAAIISLIVLDLRGMVEAARALRPAPVVGWSRRSRIPVPRSAIAFPLSSDKDRRSGLLRFYTPERTHTCHWHGQSRTVWEHRRNPRMGECVECGAARFDLLPDAADY